MWTFTSHSPGEHLICLYSNSTAWFSGAQLRVHLDIQVGEHAQDYEQVYFGGNVLKKNRLLQKTNWMSCSCECVNSLTRLSKSPRNRITSAIVRSDLDRLARAQMFDSRIFTFKIKKKCLEPRSLVVHWPDCCASADRLVANAPFERIFWGEETCLSGYSLVITMSASNVHLFVYCSVWFINHHFLLFHKLFSLQIKIFIYEFVHSF